MNAGRTRPGSFHALRTGFADAAAVFDGPTLTQEDDRFDYPEPRYQTHGRLADRLVMMAWTPTDTGLRVISMRNCHDKESRRIAPRLR